jgi:hypothetical protein
MRQSPRCGHLSGLVQYRPFPPRRCASCSYTTCWTYGTGHTVLCCALACHLCRRSFKYKPLQDDEESASLAAAAGTHADAAAGSDSVSPTCHTGGLTADLELAEAAAAADQASAAARASRTAHKEALTAAAQVGSGGCDSRGEAQEGTSTWG